MDRYILRPQPRRKLRRNSNIHNNVFTLEIKDDRTGFNDGVKRYENGLLNIQERAEDAGGRWLF
jgi:signal transduction histidine kinase